MKPKFDSKIERKFAQDITKLFKKHLAFSIERAYDFYDFTLFYHQEAIGIIEIKGGLEHFSNLNKEKLYLEHVRSNNLRYFILSNGEISEVWDLKGKIIKRCESLVELLDFLVDSNDQIPSSHDKFNEIVGILESCIRNYNVLNETILNISKYDLESHVELAGNIASFGSRSVDKFENFDMETKFFSELLGLSEVKVFYKYTNLNGAFLSLDSQSIRLNGIVGMNDTTETHYADNYIRGINSYQNLTNNEIDKMNRKFIYSCSTLEDDLTMWRLYADDCRGVSIKFSLTSDKSSAFIVKKVSYAKSDQTHPQLELLKEIQLKLSLIGIDFTFKKFNVWKHFFKPYEYSIEKEVRILYLADDQSNIKWNLTASHSILNPYVMLNFGDFPARVSEIKLGPKCPEFAINAKQFESFIRTLSGAKTQSNISMSTSRVSNYR